MKLVYLYKCRGCGAKIKKSVEEMNRGTKWMIEDIFRGNEDSTYVRTNHDFDDKWSCVFHRCDSETLCVCDMVGWRKEEE